MSEIYQGEPQKAIVSVPNTSTEKERLKMGQENTIKRSQALIPESSDSTDFLKALAEGDITQTTETQEPMQITESLDPLFRAVGSGEESQHDEILKANSINATLPAIIDTNNSQDRNSIPQKEYTSEQWQNDIKRLIRRTAIERNGSYGSLSEIKDAVRTLEKQINVDELVKSLVTEEFTISPKMAGVAKEFSEKILAKYPQVRALVLMGSSVHGGARIREATETQESADLDWGIITDGTLTGDQIAEMVNEEEKDLLALGRQYDLGEDFHSCISINPATFYAADMNNQQGFMDLINRTLYETFSEDMILYLHPSFPAEVNGHNREIIKEGLRNLHANNPSLYESAREEIMIRWLNIHALKEAHFNIATRDKDQALVTKVQRASDIKMGNPINELLKSTAS